MKKNYRSGFIKHLNEATELDNTLVLMLPLYDFIETELSNNKNYSRPKYVKANEGDVFYYIHDLESDKLGKVQELSELEGVQVLITDRGTTNAEINVMVKLFSNKLQQTLIEREAKLYNLNDLAEYLVEITYELKTL